MNIFFNELSLVKSKITSVYDINELIKKLYLTFKKLKDYDIQFILVEENFYKTSLMPNYTFYDWLQDEKANKTYKSLLFSIIKYPYLRDGDADFERFANENYYLELERQTLVGGLFLAYIKNTVSISLATNLFWNKSLIPIFPASIEAKPVDVRHVSDTSHIDAHMEWLETFLPTPKPDRTRVNPSEKQINLRDDHGKDTLEKFANKIVNSDYVIRVINSMPFNPKDTRFIKNFYDDGRIEIVLVKTDEGFGMVVQTTGMNLRETKFIAEEIEKLYSNQY